MTTIAECIEQIRTRMAAAAQRAGRDPAAITLVAVSKTRSADQIRAALDAGTVDFGENRVQEAATKVAAFAEHQPQPRWHLIGHLQRNKARMAAGLFDLVHSLDSLRLAESLDHAMQEHTRNIPVLLQVNVSGEPSKEGFDLAGGLENQAALGPLLADIERILVLPNLVVRGLMTIAPIAENAAAARPTFRRLLLLRDELARRYPTTCWDELSMGMTDDFETAIEEGATIVRVGRAIFGQRE